MTDHARLDTAGNCINAHGGGLLRVGGRYYWYGEHKNIGKDGTAYDGVHCYSSEDLRTWEDEGLAFNIRSLAPDERQRLGKCVLERPKVVQAASGTLIMWFHVENLCNESGSLTYDAAKVGVARSDSPTGPFGLVGEPFRPH
eukprot:228924-Amphidinium_carterae.1